MYFAVSSQIISLSAGPQGGAPLATPIPSQTPSAPPPHIHLPSSSIQPPGDECYFLFGLCKFAESGKKSNSESKDIVLGLLGILRRCDLMSESFDLEFLSLTRISN
jgi:hypothetical protein